MRTITGQSLQTLLTRRTFLIGTTGLALSSVLPSCSQTAKTLQPQPAKPEKLPATDRELRASCCWVAMGEQGDSYPLFKRMVEATTDFAWLSRGDRVLVKIALNSGKRYPATTDPWSVHCMIKLLKEKGAGNVSVGDQSGFGTVQWTKNRQEGSSRQLAETAGVLKVIEESGTEPCFFEESGWDAYRPTFPEGEHHWKRPIMIPTKLDEVDHIVYLPRVSSHVLAGNTLGFKLSVGFLRSDSRGALHRGGKQFYAMYEEINQVPQIASRLRLIVSSGRSVLTLVGPNDGPIAKPDYGLVLASNDLLAHEMLAYAWLQWNRQFETSAIAHMAMGRHTRSRSRYNKRFSDRMWPDNGGLGTPPIDYFEPGNLYNHPAIANHLKRMGGLPRHIGVEEINQQPDRSVMDYLKKQLNA